MNLAHYLSSGIIAPSIYIENKNNDIQDKFKNYLLLSSSKYTSETNCAIEIILISPDELPKKISENFYLFDMPLPISRIKAIYFSSEEQKINTEFNITSGSAFIPQNMLKIIKEDSLNTQEIENLIYNPSEVNWEEYLKKYDQILGGFAIMKISKEDFQNYPTHYFSTLININNLFNKILLEQNIDIENSFQFAFTNEGKFKEFHNTIYSKIDYHQVQRYAEKEKINLEVKNGLVQIDKISENTQTYLVAILDSYGKDKRKQVDSFISDLISGKFIERKKEGLSLIFGLNKGYKAFRNRYKTENFEADIKFKLDSKLDYYIIESIYQNVFNQSNDFASFEYIDAFSINNKRNDNLNYSNYETYKVIDKTIFLKKKEALSNELFHTSLEKRNNIYKKIAEKITGWFPFKIEKESIEILFKKELDIIISDLVEDSKKQINSENLSYKNTIEQLNRRITEQDQIINKLNEERNKKLQFDLKNKKVIKEKENIEVQPGKAENETLFPDDSTFSKSELSEKKLNDMTKKDLKILADNYKIPKSSSLQKPKLIEEIIKYNLK